MALAVQNLQNSEPWPRPVGDMGLEQQKLEPTAHEKSEGELISQLNRLDSLIKLNGDSKVRALTGSKAVQAGIKYFESAGDKAAAYEEITNKIKTKYKGSYIENEAILTLYGSLGEYQIQNIINNIAANTSLPIEYRHAEDEVDTAGIDAFITPPDELTEFANPSNRKQMELALSIKSAPLPTVINDVFYPCRTLTELEEGFARIADDYQSLRTGLSPEHLQDNIEQIRRQMTTAFRRLHGFEWDKDKGEWYFPRNYVSPLKDRSMYIPVIALASNQDFAPIGNYGENIYFPQDLAYTAEFQLTDNPEKWERKFYTSDVYLDPTFPFAA